MQYISSIGRMAFEEGMKLGILKSARENAITALELRFGAVPDAIADSIDAIAEVPVLHALLRQAIATASLEAFQQFLNTVAN